MPPAKQNDPLVTALIEKGKTKANGKTGKTQHNASSQTPQNVKLTSVSNAKQQDGQSMTPDISNQHSNTKEAHVASTESAQIPFAVQHMIFTRLQTVLEQICYQFTARHMPHVLEEGEWACVEALELNVWAGVMKLPKNSTTLSRLNGPKEDVLASLIAIRHSSVHREALPIPTIESHLAAAESAGRLLGEEAHQNDIAELKRIATLAIAKRAMFQSRAAAITSEYTRTRSEVDRERDERMKALSLEQRCCWRQLDEEFQRMVQPRPASLRCSGAWNLLNLVVPKVLLNVWKPNSCNGHIQSS